MISVKFRIIRSMFSSKPLPVSSLSSLELVPMLRALRWPYSSLPCVLLLCSVVLFLVTDDACELIYLANRQLLGSTWYEWFMWRTPPSPSLPWASLLPHQVPSCGWYTGPLFQCPRLHQDSMDYHSHIVFPFPLRTFLYLCPSSPPQPPLSPRFRTEEDLRWNSQHHICLS